MTRSDWYKNNSSKVKARSKKWRRANPEKHKASVRKYDQNNRRKLTDARLRRVYGISLEEYEWMLIQQCGRCLICLKEMSGPREPCIDHCHKTNKVRGLLCARHNRALGYFEDDIRVLEQTIRYLKGEL